jgi:hypothetical protein
MTRDEKGQDEFKKTMRGCIKLSAECIESIKQWEDHMVSREEFKAEQDRDFDRKHFNTHYTGGNMNTKPEEKFVTKPESALDKAYAAGFPQPTETFEQRAAREFPANIQRAIDSAKK